MGERRHKLFRMNDCLFKRGLPNRTARLYGAQCRKESRVVRQRKTALGIRRSDDHPAVWIITLRASSDTVDT